MAGACCYLLCNTSTHHGNGWAEDLLFFFVNRLNGSHAKSIILGKRNILIQGSQGLVYSFTKIPFWLCVQRIMFGSLDAKTYILKKKIL